MKTFGLFLLIADKFESGGGFAECSAVAKSLPFPTEPLHAHDCNRAIRKDSTHSPVGLEVIKLAHAQNPQLQRSAVLLVKVRIPGLWLRTCQLVDLYKEALQISFLFRLVTGQRCVGIFPSRPSVAQSPMRRRANPMLPSSANGVGDCPLLEPSAGPSFGSGSAKP
jgi:hypothetical protein